MFIMIAMLVIGIFCAWESVTKDNDAFYALIGNLFLLATLILDLLYITGVFK